jgi:D-alanine-D-alanine ligase
MVNLGLLFGGRSAEHDVSLVSARSLRDVLDLAKYTLIPVGITREGAWVMPRDLDAAHAEGLDEVAHDPVSLSADPTRPGLVVAGGRVIELDVVFPVLHGPYGEDGTVQGLLELAGLPYAGAGVAASAVAMDKELMKAVFKAARLPQVDYVVLRDRGDSPYACVAEVEAAFPYPVFVKPVNLGSSVGISKAHGRDELVEALRLAFRYDRKVIVEAFCDGRELECAVLGNGEPDASLPGEVLPANEFYDYESKYTDGKMSFGIPARLTDDQRGEVMGLAVAAFKAIDCAGFARVDFFIEKATGRPIVNEINTIPGLTEMSAFPKLWEASGLPYGELADRIVALALERHSARRALLSSR